MAILNQPSPGYLEPNREDRVARYLTKPTMIDAGMKCCDECGELSAIETQICIDCGAFIVMFVDRSDH